MSQHRAGDSTLLCEGPACLAISLPGLVGPPPGATSFCFSTPSLASGSIPLWLQPSSQRRCEGPTRSGPKKEQRPRDRAELAPSLKIARCPGKQQAAKPRRAVYVTFVGFQAFRHGRVSGELPRAAGRVSSSVQLRLAGLAVLPGPGQPVHRDLPSPGGTGMFGLWYVFFF